MSTRQGAWIQGLKICRNGAGVTSVAETRGNLDLGGAPFSRMQETTLLYASRCLLDNDNRLVQWAAESRCGVRLPHRLPAAHLRTKCGVESLMCCRSVGHQLKLRIGTLRLLHNVQRSRLFETILIHDLFLLRPPPRTSPHLPCGDD